MKRTTILILLAIMLAGCTSQTATQSNSEVANLKQAELSIEGMTCISCSQGVEYQFKQVPGVINAEVSYKTGKATVTYDGDAVTAEEISQASTVYPATILSVK